MKIINSFITNNRRYKQDAKFDHGKPIGLMLHSVGVAQSDATIFVKNNNTATAEVAVHAYIQPDGNIYQCLPWDRAGWHGGHSFSNGNYIGVEMTEPKGIRYTSGAEWKFTDEKSARLHMEATYHYAVELFAYLCKMFELNPLADGVIISHSEGAKRGIATNHADVEHIWDKVGLTMNQFRNDVYALMYPKRDYTDAINLLYADLLGRVPDEAGFKSWEDAFKNGKDFETVYNGIANSKEGRKYFIKNLYRSMLKREATADEIDYWLKGSRLAIYSGIVNSSEYKKKHS